MGERQMKHAGMGCALVLIFAAGGAFAQNLSVTYVEGDARMQRGSSWVGISTGDTLPREATVLLRAGAYVELGATGTTITLSQNGTYNLRDIVPFSRNLKSAGVGKAILDILAYLLNGPAHNQSTVAGVRSANEGRGQDAEWVTSSAGVFLDSGRQYIKAGQYDKAIAQLLRALETATDQESPTVCFYLAFAYSMIGDTRNSLKYAANVQPDGSNERSTDFIILRAKLLIDSNAYAQEVAWLTQAGNDLTGDPQRADAYLLLLGAGYRGVSDISREKQALSQVVSIAAEGDLRNAAASLLRNP